VSPTESDILDWMRRTFRDIPVTGLLGARPISYDVEARRVVIEYAGRPEFGNLIGSVHGGMLTAMLDNVMSFAILGAIEPGHIAPTIEIKTSYLAPAKRGTIVGEGSVLRLGRTVSFAEGRLTDGDGLLLATATGTARIRRR
jgi:uncharacterized protein (TIGR00369 family)